VFSVNTLSGEQYKIIKTKKMYPEGIFVVTEDEENKCSTKPNTVKVYFKLWQEHSTRRFNASVGILTGQYRDRLCIGADISTRPCNRLLFAKSNLTDD
jgi:hypothetical protein